MIQVMWTGKDVSAEDLRVRLRFFEKMSEPRRSLVHRA